MTSSVIIPGFAARGLNWGVKLAGVRLLMLLTLKLSKQPVHSPSRISSDFKRITTNDHIAIIVVVYHLTNDPTGIGD